MERKYLSQLELFSDTTKDLRASRIQNTTSHFFSYIHSYEKIILTLIALAITGVVSFSLGVEKGKRIIRVKAEVVTTPKIHQRLPPEKQEIIKPLPFTDALENYTIQVAAYRSKILAQKEAEALRKKGFLPLVLSKGKYIVLCVGNFSNRGAAQPILSELKKRYRDCYIRRL